MRHVFRHPLILFLLITLTVPLLAGLAARPAQALPQPLAADRVPAAAPPSHAQEDAFHNSPVMFIENVGQWEDQARFQVWGGPAGTMWLARDGSIWLTLLQAPQPDRAAQFPWSAHGMTPDPERTQDPGPVQAVNIKLSFVGANPNPRIEPFDRLDTVVNFFTGADETQDHTDVPVWGGVRVIDMYPGIDLEISAADDGRFSWRMVCRLGCDENTLANVRLRVTGAKSLEVLEQSFLRIQAETGNVTIPLMTTYNEQTGESVSHTIPQIEDDYIVAPWCVDRMQENLISEENRMIVWSSYLGFTGTSLTMDADGAIYITGYGYVVGVLANDGTTEDSLAMVIKLSSDGSSILFITIIDGNDLDQGMGIVVSDEGNGVLITGVTKSSDLPEKFFHSGFDGTYNGGKDAFIAQLDPEDGYLIMGSYLGGSADDEASNIALAPDGFTVYLTGWTKSSDFPIINGLDWTYNGYEDVFIARIWFNWLGGHIEWSTYYGGSGSDYGQGIAVDDNGWIYVAGNTWSSNFPIYRAADHVYRDGEAFALKISDDGTRVDYATYIGWSDEDYGHVIAIDSGGNAYIVGQTLSNDFPTTEGAYQQINKGSSDVFITKLTPSGSLDFSTYLGESGHDNGYSIDVSGARDVYIVGTTWSSDFPTSAEGDRTYNGSQDVFISKLDGLGQFLISSTYLGGSGMDMPGMWSTKSIVLKYDQLYVTGQTYSSNFPITDSANNFL